jgi:hypothetical protein
MFYYLPGTFALTFQTRRFGKGGERVHSDGEALTEAWYGAVCVLPVASEVDAHDATIRHCSHKASGPVGKVVRIDPAGS